MIGFGEAIDIHLDARGFANDEETYKVAVVVAKHVEKRRAEYRKTEKQGAFPADEHQSIGKLGALTQHNLAKSYWSDTVPWYEWMTEPQTLQRCAQECGLKIWELADAIAYQIRPSNWQVFSWMHVALHGREYEETLTGALGQHIAQIAVSRERQRRQASEAGRASGKTRGEDVTCTPEKVAREYQIMMATGTEKRDVAAKLAARFKVTPDYIRKQRNKVVKVKRD